jgi:hypothetical protein
MKKYLPKPRKLFFIGFLLFGGIASSMDARQLDQVNLGPMYRQSTINCIHTGSNGFFVDWKSERFDPL